MGRKSKFVREQERFIERQVQKIRRRFQKTLRLSGRRGDTARALNPAMRRVAQKGR